MRTPAEELIALINRGIKDALARLENQAERIRRIGDKLYKSIEKIEDVKLRREIQAELKEIAKVLDSVFPNDDIQWL